MWVNLEALESRVQLAATPAGVYEFGLQSSAHSVKAVVEDGDGTVATFALLGRGVGRVTVSDAGWDVAIEDGGLLTSLLVGTAGGDGRVTVRSISADTIARVVGPKVNLAGDATFERVKVVTLGNVTDGSISSNSAVRWIGVENWTDSNGVSDEISAPSIAVLKVSGDLGAGVATNFLGLASIGGTWSGDSTINNAGWISATNLRGALNILGSARSIALNEDYVAAKEVVSATGGSVHVGGAARIRSAGESFAFANQTLFTCTADVYTAAELIGDDTGSTRTFEQIINENGKVRRVTQTSMSSAAEPVNGQARWVVTETDSEGKITTTTWGLSADGGINIFGAQSVDEEGEAEFVFAGEGLPVAPGVLRLNQRVQSPAVATNVTLDGVTTPLTLSATGTTKTGFMFLGHQMVNTALGSFLAIKFVTTLEVNVGGTVSDGVNTVPIAIASKDFSTSLVVPGVGSVLELKKHTSRTFAQGRLIEFTWETEQKKLVGYTPATALLQ